MTDYHMDSKKFAMGAAVGGLLGSVAALLIAPQSGGELRRGICEAYDSLSDKTHHLAKKVGCQTCDWASKAKTVVDGASKTVKKWVSDGEEEEPKYTSELLYGTLAGAIVGAAAALLLAPKSGEALRHDLAHTYEEISHRGRILRKDIEKKGQIFTNSARDQGNKWLNLAQELLDDLAGQGQEGGQHLIDKAKSLIQNKRAHDAIDLAAVGLRLWREISAKR